MNPVDWNAIDPGLDLKLPRDAALEDLDDLPDFDGRGIFRNRNGDRGRHGRSSRSDGAVHRCSIRPGGDAQPQRSSLHEPPGSQSRTLIAVTEVLTWISLVMWPSNFTIVW